MLHLEFKIQEQPEPYFQKGISPGSFTIVTRSKIGETSIRSAITTPRLHYFTTAIEHWKIHSD